VSDRTRLLVKVSGDGSSQIAALSGVAAADFEAILHVPPEQPGVGLSAGQGSTWIRLDLEDDGSNPWDRAHQLLSPAHAFAAAGLSQVEAVEPDLEQQWPYSSGYAESQPAKTMKEFCAFDPQSNEGGCAVGPEIAWNLGDDFSGLGTARKSVGAKAARVVIAHLDTGYDPTHETLPPNLLKGLQRNFVDKDSPNDATDRTPPGNALFRNRGHGTGTLSLLAGNELDGQSPGWPGFKDAIGGAPLAGIIPIRIANSVVRLRTSTMVQGFDYARAQGAHVLSMSMGGVSSQALVDAVNLAYEAGLVMVTAAGNNFAYAPTPKSIVFPARYQRVLAACGVMADGRAYAGLRAGMMQGNYGPASKMKTALAAYTPNVPWAQIACEKIVDMNGAGTSAATPQIAAATALWIAQYWDELQAYSKPWMWVEAVRHALFGSADHTTSKMNAEETLEKLGQGVLRAHKALDMRPRLESELVELPPAKASWSWLNLLLGGGVSLGRPYSPQQLAMFHLELTQMAHLVSEVEQTIEDPDRPAQEIPASQRLRYLEAALDVGNPSRPLRAYLEDILQRRSAALAVPATDADRIPIRRKATNPPPPKRRLRTYALDPSLGKNLDSLALNETTLTVPWDDCLPEDAQNAAKMLQPGPVGEYLEVVDVDPASNRVYQPVDLNNRALLAQDGWPPSEGNPQFHQQMVYAVGMTTIGNFERALGRRALWAAHRPSGRDEAQYVRRLRIYPHAFRGRNAYYSPDKKALLFGYFPADSKDSDATAPGSMVFSCLSSDIIAHEMTHALLDGLHRRFEQASNPDVPAFHEAFADIVALFQHFTITELVRFEIGRSRADLSAANLLAGLAKQFGEGSSRGGPLRNYLDPAMQALKYGETEEPHKRGSILVYAVYEAFLKIVAYRAGDLLRIATGGTGVLPTGALHPDLVNRLTEEVCETAADVLQMCIRALDYCPAMDITFGEYLRAVITADRDLYPDDSGGRRVAFMEAFRNRAILPRDVRTFSEETLSWSPLDLDIGPGPSGEGWAEWLFEILGNKDLSLEWDLEADRQESFQQNDSNCRKMWQALNRLFSKNPRFYAQFGLVANLPPYDPHGDPKPLQFGTSNFEVSSARPARRVKPNGVFQTDIVVVINQRRPEPIDGIDKKKGWFWFRGGATLILDPRAKEVRYIIVKNMTSRVRLERQRKTASGSHLSPLRALYFGDNARYEPFAMMHSDLSERQYGD
jgi:Subtilase family